jgi:hypothetical protein
MGYLKSQQFVSVNDITPLTTYYSNHNGKIQAVRFKELALVFQASGLTIQGVLQYADGSTEKVTYFRCSGVANTSLYATPAMAIEGIYTMRIVCPHDKFIEAAAKCGCKPTMLYADQRPCVYAFDKESLCVITPIVQKIDLFKNQITLADQNGYPFPIPIKWYNTRSECVEASKGEVEVLEFPTESEPKPLTSENILNLIGEVIVAIVNVYSNEYK